MRVFLSILALLSVLSGSIGVNVFNSECSCCADEKLCMCSSSCSIENAEAENDMGSCCMEESDDTYNALSSCDSNGECCTSEFIKLNIPSILVFDTQKIESPQKELSEIGILYYIISVLPGQYKHQKGIPEKPPPISRSGLDLNCTFLC